MAASVHNDEIILIGGHSKSGSAKDTWGYVPTSNEWRKMDDLSIGIFDLAAIDADGVTSLPVAIYHPSRTVAVGARSIWMKPN